MNHPIILIALDDRMTRAMMSYILENDGYQVIEAGDGEECLAAYQKTTPNLVLIDAIMPRMNGFECCGELMKLPESVHTPILMITGLEDQTSVDWAFDVGAADYITKPIHWPVLRQRVRIQLERTQLYQQLELTNIKLSLSNQKLVESNKELEKLASIDGLTKLANRSFFERNFEQKWQHMTKAKMSLALIMCDVDHFKIFNDTYGHPEGDKCLIQVADTIKKCMLNSDNLPARYGGEEFIIVLPNTSLSKAKEVAENIRLSVNELAIPHKNSLTSTHVTISLGVASIIPSQEIKNGATLIKAADKALYQAKDNGRDRVSDNQSLD